MTMKKNTVELWANLSVSYQVGVLLDDVAEDNEVLALGVSFLMEQPFLENCYHNQHKIKTKRATMRKATSPTFLASK